MSTEFTIVQMRGTNQRFVVVGREADGMVHLVPVAKPKKHWRMPGYIAAPSEFEREYIEVDRVVV